ncbi:hypothetical protein llap_3293 [Limosa lapponica baueri]|uniref:Uncharacterized protein n=1 Tax=Limosa lapponica baueri TaxID=1758121 RepID=A0A2I0UK30_LIMLA|nr:hypothetical protein llap_3293 [Limosa lapponica baueri]
MGLTPSQKRSGHGGRWLHRDQWFECCQEPEALRARLSRSTDAATAPGQGSFSSHHTPDLSLYFDVMKQDHRLQFSTIWQAKINFFLLLKGKIPQKTVQREPPVELSFASATWMENHRERTRGPGKMRSMSTVVVFTKWDKPDLLQRSPLRDFLSQEFMNELESIDERGKLFGNILVKLLANCLAQDEEQQLKTTKHQVSIMMPHGCSTVARVPACKVPWLNKGDKGTKSERVASFQLAKNCRYRSYPRLQLASPFCLITCQIEEWWDGRETKYSFLWEDPKADVPGNIVQTSDGSHSFKWPEVSSAEV